MTWPRAAQERAGSSQKNSPQTRPRSRPRRRSRDAAVSPRRSSSRSPPPLVSSGHAASKQEHYKTDTPVVLEDLTGAWGARARWADLRYLRRVAGHRTVPVEVGRIQVSFPPPHPSRTKWTRLVHPSVLIIYLSIYPGRPQARGVARGSDAAERAPGLAPGPEQPALPRGRARGAARGLPPPSY